MVSPLQEAVVYFDRWLGPIKRPPIQEDGGKSTIEESRGGTAGSDNEGWRLCSGRIDGVDTTPSSF